MKLNAKMRKSVELASFGRRPQTPVPNFLPTQPVQIGKRSNESDRSCKCFRSKRTFSLT